MSRAPMTFDDRFLDDDISEEGDSLDFDIDCGLMPDGICANAGTEWCDFECPYSK